MNDKLKIAIPILSALLLGFFCGNSLVSVSAKSDQRTPPIEPVSKVEVKMTQTHTVAYKYVERPITEVKYVEKIEKVPMELAHFENVDELQNWLQTSSVSAIDLHTADSRYDCDDYALILQHRSLSDGFILSVEIINAEEYNDLFEEESLPVNSLHAINLATIGNSAYYIEPQTNEVVLAAYLD